MKTLKIAEIGLNHFGNKRFLGQYLECLTSKNIDGVTIQVLEDSFYKKNFRKFKLKNETIEKFINYLKKKNKLAGIITNDAKKIKFFDKLNIDFYKVLSSNIKDIELIKKLQKSNCKKIYLSTGMVNYLELKDILARTSSKKISLIHTSFKNNINLNRMNILKKKFKLPVCYGNHSKILNSLSLAKKYKPRAIFFYVKLKKKMEYPDNIHAINLENINKYIN